MALPVPTNQPARQFTVLVASQREALTRALTEALREHGSQPIVQQTATGASAALDLAAVDFVVIDAALPGVNWDLVRQALAGGVPADPEPLEVIEQRHIAAMLRHTRGNRRNAAQLLGIARSTLLAKIRRYGLDRDPSLRRG